MAAIINADAEKPSERLKRVATCRVAFRAIRVEYAPQEDFMAALEEVRLVAAQSDGGQLTAVQLIAGMGTGKTSGAERFVADLLARGEHPEGTIPAAVARLDTTGTTASIPTAILRALGEPRPDHGKEELRWLRARTAIREKQTHLIAFDEVNRGNRRPTVSPIIADSFRDFLDEGVVGLAFIGTADAEVMLEKCPALTDRLDAPVAMAPLDWQSDADKQLAEEFATAMDKAIHAAGLLDRPIGLADHGILQPLVEASTGTLRRICGVLERAVCAAEADRSRIVTREDLADVVDAWLMPKRQIEHNPFRGAA